MPRVTGDLWGSALLHMFEVHPQQPCGHPSPELSTVLSEEFSGETLSSRRVFGYPQADRPNTRTDREDDLGIEPVRLKEGSSVLAVRITIDSDVCEESTRRD